MWAVGDNFGLPEGQAAKLRESLESDLEPNGAGDRSNQVEDGYGSQPKRKEGGNYSDVQVIDHLSLKVRKLVN